MNERVKMQNAKVKKEDALLFLHFCIFNSKFLLSLMRRQRVMRVAATRRDGRTVVTEMKLALDFRESEDVESVSIKTRRQIIGRKQIDSRRVTCFGTNLQQALYDFQRSEHSDRVSVGCHFSEAPPFLSAFPEGCNLKNAGAAPVLHTL